MQWNLDQLHLFMTVAECGSFSAAARRLGRAQSVVSTAIAHLEADLGLTLFDRQGRLPQLTESGVLILQEARSVWGQCQRLEQRAQHLSSRHEAHLKLAVDEALPLPHLTSVLTRLGDTFPELTVSLFNGSQSDISRWVAEGGADLGVLLQEERLPSELNHRCLGALSQVVVASRHHPLSQQAYITLDDLARYRQLVICASPPDTPGRQRDTFSAQYWPVNSFYSIAELVMCGMGWAIMPAHVSDYPVYRDELVCLSGDLPRQPVLEIELVWHRAQTLSPVGLWLQNALSQSLSR